jgi:hypothetical protein
MKVTLESTDEIAKLLTPDGLFPARVWIGRTEGGVECVAYITRIAVLRSEDNNRFERELLEKPATATCLDWTHLDVR